MVAYPRTAVRPDRLRALNQPRRIDIDVEYDSGAPAAISQNGRWVPVAEIMDGWVVEDGWWWAPVARRYLHLMLADGRSMTVFEDLIAGGWYLQRYPFRAASEL